MCAGLPYRLYGVGLHLKQPMTNTRSNRKRIEVGATELRQHIARHLNAVVIDGAQVVISRQGHPEPIAVLLSHKEFERLTAKSAA